MTTLKERQRNEMDLWLYLGLLREPEYHYYTPQELACAKRIVKTNPDLFEKLHLDVLKKEGYINHWIVHKILNK